MKKEIMDKLKSIAVDLITGPRHLVAPQNDIPIIGCGPGPLPW